MDSEAKVERGSDGKLKPGSVLNPHGQNGNTGLQPYGRRSAFLLEKYTASQIKAIAADEKLHDSVSMYDLVIIKHLARTIGEEEPRLEREALLDRMEGKALETHKMQGDKDNPFAVTVTFK